MKDYVINRLERNNFCYCEIMIDNVVKYCYYVKKDNKFVNRVYFIIGNNYRIGEFLDNSVYVFCQGVSQIFGMVEILKKEFYYIDYVFVFNDDKFKNDILKIGSDAGVPVIMWSFEEYFKRNRIQISNIDLNNGYFDSNNEKDKQIADVIKKEYVDYNGFNERLIDKNVKNIVQINKKSDGDSNEL